MKCQTSVRQVANETAIATGSSRVRVLKIQKETEQGPLVTPRRKWERRKVQINLWHLKFSFDQNGRRWRVKKFCCRNELPTLNSVLETRNSHPDQLHYEKTDCSCYSELWLYKWLILSVAITDT
jgi:hypothetical protein